jgi:hypothetical protein
MNIKSKLIGPYSIRSLKEKGFNKCSTYSEREPIPGITISDIGIDRMKIKMSGVYLWGVRIDGRYIPLYVGKAHNIPERVFQHIIRFKGGEYLVPDWKEILNDTRDFSSFRKTCRRNRPHLPQGLLYYPDGSFDFEKFETDELLSSTVNKVMESFFVCWKHLAAYDQFGKSEEEALASAIGKEKLISSHSRKPTPPTEFIDDFLHILSS